MQYEVYVDVLFAINFGMDVLVLLTVRKLMGSTATLIKVFLGSFIGAAGFCFTYLLFYSYKIIQFILIHGVVSCCMVKFGLNKKGVRPIFSGMILLYIVSFLYGGIFQFLYTNSVIGKSIRKLLDIKTFIVLSLCSYLFFLLIVKCYQIIRTREENICEVTIWMSGKSISVKALIDTGNSLTEPISRKPVSVLSYTIIELFLKEDVKEQIKGVYG